MLLSAIKHSFASTTPLQTIWSIAYDTSSRLGGGSGGRRSRRGRKRRRWRRRRRIAFKCQGKNIRERSFAHKLHNDGSSLRPLHLQPIRSIAGKIGHIKCSRNMITTSSHSTTIRSRRDGDGSPVNRDNVTVRKEWNCLSLLIV